MKFPVFPIVLCISIAALLALAGMWWINGREETWFYAIAGIIVLTSLFSARPQKK